METSGIQDVVARSLLGAQDFLILGGPAIWAIALITVLALALILWKIWRLLLARAFSNRKVTARALERWLAGDRTDALALVDGRPGPRARLVAAAMRACLDPALTREGAEAETARVARAELIQLRSGLRALELIATIGPLLGLLGTVTGMISAFQALQEAGTRADPATLAGGIWEALLTTAAGMAVAIPVSMALTWFESVIDRLRHEMEDAATRIFLRAAPARSDKEPEVVEAIARAPRAATAR